jgi:WD40 repeat protein
VGKPNGRPAPFDFDYSLWDMAGDTAAPGLPQFTYAQSVGNIVRGMIDGGISTYDVVTKQVKRIALSIDDRALPSSDYMSTDGDLLLLGYDRHVELVDVATGGVVQRFLIPDFNDFPRAARQLATNDDHSRVYVAGPGLFAFDAETGDEIVRIDDDSIASVAVSARGVLVASSRNGTIGVYDPKTLVETASLPGARGFVAELRFSDDGNTLLAASDDGTVSIYDIPTHTRLGDPMTIGLVGDNSHVDLRGDGKQAAVTRSDATGAVLLDLDPDHWVTAACALAGRSLARDEWTTYIGDLGSYRATCPEFPETMTPSTRATTTPAA